MSTLYVTSAETFSGKSALCVGVGVRLRKDGLKAGYMKPVSVNCPVVEGLPYDEDVAFAKKIYGMPEPNDLLLPVALTPAKFEQQLRGPEVDYAPRFAEVFKKVSEGRDVMVLEGGRSLREGYVAVLPPLRVAELTDAKVLGVVRYDDTLMVDRARTAQNYFKDRLIGMVVNETPPAQVEWVNDAVLPYFARHGIASMGVLPRDQLLAAPSVRELAEGLNAEVLCAPEKVDELVEHMLVGAMSVESALTYFRRKPHKAVITGGDRSDIALAALETSTRCLILTGHLYPSPAVLNRAEELQVPVLLCNLDTLAAVDITEGYFGRSRFQQPQKVERFSKMLDEYLNFDLLYKKLGLKA
jgi:BioD-like phosphotransacetylase family protein